MAWVTLVRSLLSHVLPCGALLFQSFGDVQHDRLSDSYHGQNIYTNWYFCRLSLCLLLLRSVGPLSKVPSVYLIADGFLVMHALSGQRLFHLGEGIQDPAQIRKLAVLTANDAKIQVHHRSRMHTSQNTRAQLLIVKPSLQVKHTHTHTRKGTWAQLFILEQKCLKFCEALCEHMSRHIVIDKSNVSIYTKPRIYIYIYTSHDPCSLVMAMMINGVWECELYRQRALHLRTDTDIWLETIPLGICRLSLQRSLKGGELQTVHMYVHLHIQCARQVLYAKTFCRG